jgi:hypothetical protein
MRAQEQANLSAAQHRDTQLGLALMLKFLEPVSGFEPLTCRLQDGCSAC